MGKRKWSSNKSFSLILGAVAQGDFDEDELIFSIPRDATLSIKNALPDILKNKSDVSPDAFEALPSWAVRYIPQSRGLDMHR